MYSNETLYYVITDIALHYAILVTESFKHLVNNKSYKIN